MNEPSSAPDRSAPIPNWASTATIAGRTGYVTVNAYPTRTPGLVVNLGLLPQAQGHSDYWNVTHAASGYTCAAGFETFSEAQSAAARFKGIVDWTSFSTVDEFRELSSPEFLQACRDARDGVTR